MNIILRKLILTNFKAIRSLAIEFGDETNIFGRNEAGKTTIHDACRWLFFGKDSTDRADFEIKTLDKNNRVISKLSHEVEAVLDIDGSETILKRVLEEKWEKKRGTPEPVFTGNQTSYFWNGVPLKQSEYQAKINGLMDEKIFKLITNALYFNDALKWEERRSVLTQISGIVTDQEIAAGDTEYEKLLAEVGKETLKEYKAKLLAKKKKLKEALETLPTRIDEATRSLPDVLDFSVVEKNLQGKRNELAGVEQEMNESVAALKEKHDAINAKQTEIQGLRSNIISLENGIRNTLLEKKSNRESSLSALRRDLRNANDELTANKSDYLNAENRKKQIITEQNNLRTEWNGLNTQQSDILKEEFVFDDSKCNCPTCKQKLPETDINQQKDGLEKNFNNNKTSRLNTVTARMKSITDTGKKLGDEVNILDKKVSDLLAQNETLVTKIADLQSKLSTLEEEHSQLSTNEAQELTNALSASEEIKTLKSKIEILEKEMEVLNTQEPDNSALKQRKINIQGIIDLLNKQLALKDQRTKTEERIAQLNDEEKDLAQQIADLEASEFTIERFERAKSDALEQKVNGMFKHVTFKLFETQINGAEAPCCITLYKGVPWTDLNTAGKIWAGLDIISVLNNHYNVRAPIFLDNRESTTEIPDINAQIINLIVSPEDATLRVEAKQMAEAV